MPKRSHIWSRTNAPPSRRESTISTSELVKAGAAPIGSSTRLIEDARRASASLSTLSARPKLWMTLATRLPVTGWRSLWASCR